MPLPDKVTIAFEGKHTQFNGITLDILRKNDNVLVKFHGIATYDEKQALQTLALIERLKKRPEFEFTDVANVPDAQYFAPDISDAERKDAIYLTPTPGNTPESAQHGLLQALKFLKATPKRGPGAAPPSQAI